MPYMVYILSIQMLIEYSVNYNTNNHANGTMQSMYIKGLFILYE